MDRRYVLVAVAGLLACAERPLLPPGNELEFPDYDGPRPRTAMDNAKPVDHEAISAAFSPVEASASDAPETDLDRFEQAYPAGLTRLNGSDGLDASAAYQELLKLARAAAPEAEQRVHAARAAACRRAADLECAADAAEDWLRSCGPTGVSTCRERALTALDAASLGPSGALLRSRVATLRKQDACLTRAMEGSPSRCLPAARAFFEREGDPLMIQRAWLATARTTRGPAASAAFLRSDRSCDEARCLDPERRLLRDAAARSLKRKDPRLALQLALEDAHVEFGPVSPSQTFYARTQLVNQSCAALDARAGSGACQRLEADALKRAQPDAAARQIAKDEGLSAEAVKSVNDRFGMLIQECLADEADRLRPPDSEHYGVSWVVLNDGRVDQVHLDRRDRDASPLAQCLRAQFAIWRYPHYRGELQHVEQRFEVSARERR